MLYISDNVPLMTCHVAKFYGITPSNPKVMSANTLNYKPIFDQPSLKKIVGKAPIPSGVQANKIQTFYSTCKNFGAQHPLGTEIWYSEKSDYRGIIASLNLCKEWTELFFLFRTFFAQCGRKRYRSNIFPILDISIHSGNIRVQSGKGVRNRAKISMFFAPPNFFFGGGSPPNFWTGVIKCYRA